MDRTSDGVEITIGLAVWDYDLELGTVTGEPSAWNPGWWHVTPVTANGHKLMDGSRLTTVHPFTGVEACTDDTTTA
jgi:hypothetical protein